MTDSICNILAWSIGTPELIVLLVVALLIWGRRLPEIARGMGKSVHEFKKGLREAEDASQEVTKEIRKAGDDVAREVKDSGSYPKASS